MEFQGGIGIAPGKFQWRHNGRDGVSNHQLSDCLLNRLFRRRSKKTSKLRVAGLCAGNSPMTGEFHAQMASNTENISISWRHHGILWILFDCYSANETIPTSVGEYLTPIHKQMLSSKVYAKQRTVAICLMRYTVRPSCNLQMNPLQPNYVAVMGLIVYTV